MENRVIVKGHGILNEATEKEGVYGAGEADRKVYTNNYNSKSSNNARAGLIKALTNPTTDFSNGAYYWHGADFDIDSNTGKSIGVTGNGGYKMFYLKGVLFTDSKHDIWKQGNKSIKGKTIYGTYSYTYKSTAAYGQTTFLEMTYKYRSVQYLNRVATPMGGDPNKKK